MALTVTVERINSVGNKKTVDVKIVFPNPYVVGGIALDPKVCGLVKIDHVQFRNPAINEPTNTLGFDAKYVPATGMVQLFKANGTTNLLEVTAVDTSAIVARGTVTGY